MRRLLPACLGLALSLAAPVVMPTPAQAVTINITIGTNLNNGRAITCRDGSESCTGAVSGTFGGWIAAGGSWSIAPGVAQAGSKLQ